MEGNLLKTGIVFCSNPWIYISFNSWLLRCDTTMAKQSIAGMVLVTILSALMIVFSFLWYEYGESNISLILLFAGLLLAAILAVIVLMQKNSDSN